MQNLQITTELNIGSSVTASLDVYIRQNDTNLWQAVTQVFVDGQPYDVSAAQADLLIIKPDGALHAITGTTTDTNTTTFNLTEKDSDIIGGLRCQVVYSPFDRSQTVHSRIFEIPIVR